MKKIFRHIKFYFKMASKNLVRHFGLAFSASCAVSITLILISVFMLLSANIQSFTMNIENQLVIRASIDTIVDDAEKEKLQKEIESLDGVKKVTLSTGEEELESYRKEYEQESALFDMYDGENNPIRDTFLVEVTQAEDLEDVTKHIESMNGIVSADFGGETTSGMISTFTAIRDGSLIFIIFLIIVAVLLISNKIKMSIYTRKQEIAIMRFIGASNWSIKCPMMLEGICIGILGSILPIILTIFGYQFLYQKLNGTFMSNMFVLQDVYPLTVYISCILVMISSLVGLVGSFFSTTRYLRWKR